MNIYLQHSLRRRLLAAIGGALVLLLVMMVLYPGGPAAAAKSISAGVKMIILGSYSRAQQVEAFIKGEPPPDDIWKISVFPGYTVGGNGPPGIHLEVVTVANLTEAQEQVAFQIQTPGYLPEGYTLREIKLAPVWTGLGEVLFPNNPTAFLIYNGPGSDIAIIQQPVGPEPTGDHNVAVGRAVGFMTDGSLVEVDLEGRTAAWADEMLLMWEEDGFSYTVGGPELSLEDAIRVAVTLN